MLVLTAFHALCSINTSIGTHHVSFAFMQTSTPFRLNTSNNAPTNEITTIRTSASLLMAKSPIIDQWTTATNGGISGIVKNSPNPRLFKDGESLTTSKIISNKNLIKEGAVVKTESGSQYTLGVKKGSSAAATTTTTSTSTSTPQRPIRPPFNPTNSIPSIRNWTINLDGTINGNVFGGPKNRNGDFVQTSPIRNNRDSVKEGDVITTITGSKYQLGIKKTSPFDSINVKKSETKVQTKVQTTTTKDNNTPKPKSGLFQSLPKRDKTPKPFANIRVPSTQDKQDDPNLSNKVPVLDDWTLDRQNRLNGIISNSPFTYETDGKSVLTKSVATDSAFIVEGFTIFTDDGRSYKLGTPKKGREELSTTTDEVIVYGTPTLANWDISDNNRIVGTMQNTNDPNIPNGQKVTTDNIITNPKFIAEGFTVVTSTGNKYKLGRRDEKSSKQEVASVTTTSTSAATSTPTLENWIFDEIGRVTGTISNSEDNRSNGRVITTAQTTFPTMLLRTGVTVYGDNGTAYKLGTEREQLQLQNQQSNTQQKSLNRNNLILIDDWCMTAMGGVSGIVSNSQDPNIPNGDMLTTSKIVTEDIRDGKIVETLNGSVYILGSRSKSSMVSNTPIESPETPVGVGLWVVVALLFVILNNGMY